MCDFLVSSLQIKDFNSPNIHLRILLRIFATNIFQPSRLDCSRLQLQEYQYTDNFMKISQYTNNYKYTTRVQLEIFQGIEGFFVIRALR